MLQVPKTQGLRRRDRRSKRELGKKRLSEAMDAGNREGRQDRKRKAALEQGNILKKIKKRQYQ